MTKSKSFNVQQQNDQNNANGRNGFDNPTFRNDLELQEVHHKKNGIEENDPTKPSNDPSQGYDTDDHKVPLDILLKRYGTNVTRGLSDSQVVANRETHGRNELTPPPKPSQVWKFIKAVWGGLNFLLWCCCFLSFLSFGAQYLLPGDVFFLGCSLIVVVHVSGSFSFYQEFKSDRIMESFKNMVPRAAYVHRNGRRIEIAVSQLVVGDIVEVKFGDLIPADIRILECQDFKVDNSSLTGESEPCKRSPECTSENVMETKNMAFFSTNALEGVAKAVVVRVGVNTLMGKCLYNNNYINA
ncbi:Sodium/potassium-transporting ATPase subunit alpha-A [Folsomia candida]|uniref:Na(+)/K(+)-exchanging ATPase n=1 Tax=Folsomia candida TaxID=158441 RepID=A0A226EU88_FOLCA|nr:Sodium/potassium-transporting ATPase subunit alpha-A [Folsomia candida]